MLVMHRPGLVLFVLALTPVFFAAQRSPQSTGGGGSIYGTAVDFKTRELLANVTLRLAPWHTGGTAYIMSSDMRGHFEFHNVRTGDYELEGEKAGYIRSSFGARRAGSDGAPLHVVSGSDITHLEVNLIKCSVLSGKVVDENGQPVSGALIDAFYTAWIYGHPVNDIKGQASSNDRGEYRLTDLPPSRYYLHASAKDKPFVEEPGGPEKQLLPEFYPSARTPADAIPIEIEPGQELTGIDFTLHTGNVFHIRGKLTGAAFGAAHDDWDLEASLHGVPDDFWSTPADIKNNGAFDIGSNPPATTIFNSSTVAVVTGAAPQFSFTSKMQM